MFTSRIEAVVTSAEAPTISVNDVIVASESSTVVELDTPTISNIISALEGVQTGVPTRTTATLTPTTLRNIEQLLELPPAAVQPPEIHSNQAGFVPPPVQPSTASTFVDNKSWGGGIVTLAPVQQSSPPPSATTSRGSSIATNSNSRSPPLTLSETEMPSLTTHIGNSSNNASSGRRTGGRRPNKDERLTPEEEERRRQRRERNKQAAARCRKRRLDQTMRLQGETDDLEEKRMNLQQEIQQLQQQREELEFLLAAHKTSCKKSIHRTPPPPPHHSTASTDHLYIKTEPEDMEEMSLSINAAVPTITSTTIAPPPVPRRPTSLPLSRGIPDLGVVIETPSNVLGLNFESMMEGGTGLTPMATSSTGLTPLTTPVVSTAPTTNCGSQQRSSSSDLSSPEATPPKLVSL